MFRIRIASRRCLVYAVIARGGESERPRSAETKRDIIASTCRVRENPERRFLIRRDVAIRGDGSDFCHGNTIVGDTCCRLARLFQNSHDEKSIRTSTAIESRRRGIDDGLDSVLECYSHITVLYTPSRSHRESKWAILPEYRTSGSLLS